MIKQSLLVDGSVTAYSVGVVGEDDEFKVPLLANQLKDIFIRHDTSQTEDINTGDMKTVIQEIELGSSDIKRYRLKEDWIFDKQRSTMDIRIIGIAPLKEKRGDDGEVQGYTPLFWLYFPELRYVLANWEVFNRENDAERRSFDHLFWTRQFSSTIIKESNVYDRPLAEFKTGINGVLESESIKQGLFEFEHDLWNF